MSRWWDHEDDDFDPSEPLDPDKDYSNWELEQIANTLLREDSNNELCRKCGNYGKETGQVESAPQIHKDTGDPLTDDAGNVLYMDFPELICENGHRWYLGEGKRRGIDGENPILFENHLQERRRREIYTEIGTPDPSLTQDRFGRPTQGIYNRTHPDGRKVNTISQRRKSGAAYYR
jgi:hypothetical protein